MGQYIVYYVARQRKFAGKAAQDFPAPMLESEQRLVNKNAFTSRFVAKRLRDKGFGLDKQLFT